MFNYIDTYINLGQGFIINNIEFESIILFKSGRVLLQSKDGEIYGKDSIYPFIFDKDRCIFINSDTQEIKCTPETSSMP